MKDKLPKVDFYMINSAAEQLMVLKSSINNAIDRINEFEEVVAKLQTKFMEIKAKNEQT